MKLSSRRLRAALSTAPHLQRMFNSHLKCPCIPDSCFGAHSLKAVLDLQHSSIKIPLPKPPSSSLHVFRFQSSEQTFANLSWILFNFTPSWLSARISLRLQNQRELQQNTFCTELTWFLLSGVRVEAFNILFGDSQPAVHIWDWFSTRSTGTAWSFDFWRVWPFAQSLPYIWGYFQWLKWYKKKKSCCIYLC